MTNAMKTTVSMLAVGACLSWAMAAGAEPYVDYTPLKGVTHVQTIKVDPNHIDDYITGLKKSWVPGEEIAKKHGVIDYYQLMVKLNGGAGANVVLIEHYPSIAALDPDQARDQAMEKEGQAIISKDQSTALTNGFDKYREFISDDYYQAVEFAK
jgi:hypothetical protein